MGLRPGAGGGARASKCHAATDGQGGGGGGGRRRGEEGQRTLEQNGAVGIILATARVTFASEQNVPRGVYFGVKRPLDPLKLREI